MFAPAAVAVTALKSGRTFHAGAVDGKLLEASFGEGDA
ncbi:MAG TPA: methenyltetrahydromethanopterin cyclohydrolase [Burkholderiales bacterium]|nr:methenyltetrahydromethanopterin cyclohydrolase [Burkholderiales bacterium]